MRGISATILGARLRRLVVVVAFSLVATVMAAVPTAAVGPPADADVALGVASFAMALDGMGSLPTFDDNLPMTGDSPRELLRLDTIFTASLATKLAAYATDGTGTSIQNVIESADTSYGPLDAGFSNVTVSVPGGDDDLAISFDVELAIDDLGLPLAHLETTTVGGEEQLLFGLVGDAASGGVPTDLSMTASFELRYEDSASDPGEAMWLVGTPTITVTALGSNLTVDVPALFGFSDVAVGGSAAFDFAWTGDVVDPDGEVGITRGEWESTLADDLFPIVPVDGADNDIAIDLTLDSPFVAGTSDKTLTWMVADRTDGAAATAPTLSTGDELDAFANASADDALLGLSQLASALAASQAQTDIRLPFLDARLSDGFSPADDLVDFVAEQSNAALVCGKTDTDPPSAENLPGTTWYCQAYTNADPLDPASISWSIDNGALVAGDHTDTVGLLPTANAKFTGVTGYPDVTVTWDADDGLGNALPTTARRRFRHASELRTMLDDAGFTGAVTYDEATDALLFDIAVSQDPASFDASFVIGDALRTGTDLAGLEPLAQDNVTVDVGQVDLDVGFGLSLVDDVASLDNDATDEPRADDRFFLQVDPAAPEYSVADISVTPPGTADFSGMVGFLAVDVATSNFTIQKGAASALAAVDISAEANGSGISDSVLLSDVLQDLPARVTPTHGATMSATFEVTPTTPLPGFPAAPPTITVTWPIVSPGTAPDVVPDAATYVPVLRPFDVTPTVRGVNTVAGNGFVVGDSGQDFTSAFAFSASAGDTIPGATLVNLSTGGSCTGVEFVNVGGDLGIKCIEGTGTDSGLAGGILYDADGIPVPEPLPSTEAMADNDWSLGDGYEVRGASNTLAFVALESLYDLANRLDSVGGAFDASLPLVGLSPHDLVPQFAAVREAVSEVTALMATTGSAPEGGGAITGTPPQNLTEFAAALDLAIAKALDPTATTGAGLVSFAYDPSLASPASVSAVPHLKVLIGDLTSDGDNTADDVRLRVLLPDGDVGTPDLELVGDSGVASDLTVTWDSVARLDIAMPLHLDVPSNDVLVLGATGVTSATLAADGTEMDLTGSFGALDLVLGTSNQLTGTHQAYAGTASADAATTASGTADHEVAGTATAGTAISLSDTGAFAAVLSGGTLTAGANACTVDSVTDDTLTCDAALADPATFAAGDEYTYSWTSTTVLHTTPASLTGALAGDILRNTTDSGSCRIGSVGAGTLTCAAALTAGDWSDGDAWEVISARTLTDDAATPALDAIADLVGATLTHETSNATCTIVSVTGDTVTCTAPLDDGTDGLITVAEDDAYSIAVSSTTVLHEDGTAFETFGFATGAGGDTATNTTDAATCTIGSLATSELTCDAALTGGGSWDVDDAYRLPGVGVAHLNATFSMTGGGTDKLLDSLTDPYVENLTGILGGTQNDCGNGLVGDLCLRLSVGSPVDGGGAPDFLGTVSYATDLAAAPATATLPAALADAKAVAPLDFGLMAEAAFFLESLLGDALDGNRSGNSVLLLGSDLGAGSGIELDALTIYDAISDVGAAAATVTDPADLEAALEAAMTTALAGLADQSVVVVPDVTVVCDPNCNAAEGMDDVDDVTVTFTVGRNLGVDEDSVDQGCTTCGADTVSPAPIFDLGLPGLDASGEGALDAKVGYTLAVGFGLSRDDGPYLTTGDTQLQVGARATIASGGSCTTSLPGDNTLPGTSAKPSDFDAGRCFDGRVGLFPVTFFDGAQTLDGGPANWADQHNAPSHVDMLATIGLSDGFTPGKLDMGDLLEGTDADIEIDAEGNLDLYFVAQVGDVGTPALPSVQGTLNVVNDTAASTEAPWPQIEYRNVVLDVASFFDGFLGPIATTAAKYVKPFIPIVDMITAPIPVLSDVAQLVGQPPVTLLSLLQEASGSDLSLITNLASFLKLVVAVGNAAATGAIGLGPETPTAPGSPPITSSGGFKIDKEQAATGPCGKEVDGAKQPKTCAKNSRSVGLSGGTATLTDKKAWVKPLADCPAAGCTGKELARTVSRTASVGITGGGVSFPFMNSASEIYGMILGADATLVRIDLGTLTATAGLSVSWGPFMAGPLPVEISIGGSVSLSGRFAMGFDTRGIRAARESGGGGLLEGVFIDDLDASGVDVPEIKLVTTFTLGASVSISVVKVGLEGGVIFTIELNLNDPNNDGKLRIEEIRSFGSDPLCLFDARGLLEFYVAVFVEIDLKFWTKKWSFDIWRLKPPLELFNVHCDPPPPVLAEELTSAVGGGTAGDVLLNMGSSTRRGARSYEIEEINEKFIVRQLEPIGATTSPDCPHSWSSCTTISVSAFGLYQEFKVKSGGKVVARADDGADTLLIQTFTDEVGNEQPFQIPADLDGGVGKDRIEGGEGDDVLRGGPDTPVDDPDNDGEFLDDRDVVKGDRGNDTLYGGYDNDSLDGAIGTDTLDGGPGNDRMTGGPGADLLKGGSDADTLIGGPGLTRSLSLLVAGKRYPDAVDAAAKAALALDLEDLGDVLVGGAGEDDLQGHHGDDVLFGDDADDGAGATFGDTTLRAGLNSTQIAAACSATGAGGRDRLEGERGDDTLIGGGDDDQLAGSHGHDTLCGNDGDDLLDADPDTDGVTPGNDILNGGAGADRLYGRVGDDTLDGGAGADLVDGGDGQDLLEGGDGPDYVLGGTGHDIAIGDAADVSARLGGGTASGAEAIANVTNLTGADTGSVTVCTAVVTIIDGKLDVDGNGSITAADDGWVAGVPVIDGRVDLYTDGSIDDGSVTPELADNGALADRVVLAGEFDADANGSITAADDGAVRAAVLQASGNADCVLGGDGNDGLWGVGGADRVAGDDGHDHVDGGAGDDQLRGSLGNDNLRGGSGNDTMYGDSGLDTMLGDTGNDTMYGGLDNDHLEGNTGADNMQGDAGNDHLIGGSAAAGADDSNVDLGAGPIGDTIRGNAGADVIAGDNATITAAGVVTLRDRPGGAAPTGTTFGDDIIDGGRDADRIYGQSGNDTIHGDDASLDPGLGGGDLIEGNAGADMIWGDGGNDDIIGGSTQAGEYDGNVTVVGIGLVGDRLHGGDGNDLILGDNGIGDDSGGWIRYDVLHDDDSTTDADDDALSGDDRIFGDAGADDLLGQGGDDAIYGDERTAGDGDAADAADHIEGNSGQDVLYGHGGADLLVGGSTEANVLDTNVDDGDSGTPDGDLLLGGQGADVLLGDNGMKTVSVQLYDVLFDDGASDSHDDLVSGDDRLNGGPDDDRIFGQGGNDVIHGDGGEDYAEGNHAADVLFGDAGEDILVGGGSADDGLIVLSRVGDGLLDGGDTIWGGTEPDVIAGDNARIVTLAGTRPDGAMNRLIELFDVLVVGGSAADTDDDHVSARDLIDAGSGNDRVFGQGGNDAIHGNDGDDYLEGNAGRDTVAGDGGEDDVVGGGSSTNGVVVSLVAGNPLIDRLQGAPSGLTDPSAAGLLDADDTLYGDSVPGDVRGTAADSHDVVLGDNGRITRPGGTMAYSSTRTRTNRIVAMADVAPGDTSGSDAIWGGDGDDDLYGQFDDTAVGGQAPVLVDGNAVAGDLLYGGAGDDAIIADQGRDTPTLASAFGSQQHIAPKSGFAEEDIYLTGTLIRVVELTQIAVGGDDVVIGGTGNDAIHTGAGDDLADGGADRDVLFGSDGDDALWGGTERDHVYGGAGSDWLDVKPRVGVAGVADDDPLWTAVAPSVDTDGLLATTNGSDLLYGGWGPDALQADEGSAGQVPGDRLMDWSGAYNVYYVCDGAYGAGQALREPSPGIDDFLHDLATSDGATDVTSRNSSGWTELRFVYRKDISSNTNPVHPDHPGHFACG